MQANAEHNEFGEASYVFNILSWNLDGLDNRDLAYRTMYIIEQIRKYKPSAIYLQEVVNYSHNIFIKYLSDPYYIVSPFEAECGNKILSKNDISASNGIPQYYVILLISKYHFKILDTKLFLFPTSKMGRHLLYCIVNLIDLNINIALATSHFESLYEYSEERINQIILAGIILGEYSANYNAVLCILGGDSNLRDAEYDKLKQNNSELNDIYLMDSNTSNYKFTWDMTINHNNKRKTRYKNEKNYRHRFDRFFLLDYLENKYDLKTNSSIIGTDYLVDIKLFASDHWGLLTNFQLNSK